METNELKQKTTVEDLLNTNEQLTQSLRDALNAVISGQTRELLIMLAGLRDIENSFCNWKNKYGIVSDNDTDHFIQLTTQCGTLIQESIIKSINDNLGRLDFKAI